MSNENRVVDPQAEADIEVFREALRGWQTFGELVTRQNEALRELLSYCRTTAESTMAQCPGCGEPEGELREVADRLSKILDGEL